MSRHHVSALLGALLLSAAAPAVRAVDFGAPIVIAGEATGAISVWNQDGKLIDIGQSSFNANDAIAVGDVDGDGADEIVVAGDVSGDIDIYRLGGSTTPRWTFSSGFGIADEIAVGDVMGDGKAEILVVDDVSEDVTIYDFQGNVLASFDVNYTALDGFALGQFDGTGKLELFVAGEALHHVEIYDATGTMLHWVLSNYDAADGFGVGDLNGDGIAEIVVAGDISGDVYVYDLSSTLQYQWSGGFAIGNGFAVADIDANGAADIVIAGGVSHVIDVFDMSGSRRHTFTSDFTVLDGLAVGWKGYPDRDNDGLLDPWEENGFDADEDGVIDVDLPGMGASPDHKDIFLELDWVPGEEPRRAEVQLLIAAFAAAPMNAGGFDNPDLQPGITIHVDTGTLTDPTALEGVTAVAGSCQDFVDNDNDGFSDDADNTCREGAGGPGSCNNGLDDDDDGVTDAKDGNCREGYNSCSDGADNDGNGLTDDDDPICLVGDPLGGGNVVTTPVGCLDAGFYSAKAANFAAARKRIFRYAVSADSAVASTCGGGYGEVGGNDFIDLNHDGGTIMHELGHNLGLRHGGDDTNNCEPNYVSAMNYDNQFFIQRTDGSRIIDYAPALRADGTRGVVPPSMVENSLVESNPIDPIDTSLTFVFVDSDGKKKRSAVNQPVDFDGDGSLGASAVANLDTSGDDGRPGACANSSTTTTLDGYDDWRNIRLSFRQDGDYATGAKNPEPEREMTLVEMEGLARSLNSTDLAAEIDDSVDPAVAGETLTYTLRARNVGINPTSAASLRMTVPAGLQLVSAADCNLSPGLLTCDVGFLPAGQVRVFTAQFAVAADLVHVAGAPVTLTANVTVLNAAGADPIAANNGAAETTLVVAKADLVHLGATTLGVPAEILIGDTASVTLAETITSNGPSSPMDVRVTRTATAAPGASVTLAETTVVSAALATAETRNVNSAATVQCALPGTHGFGLTSSIAPARPDDIDPDLSNNDAGASFALECVVPVSIRVMPTLKGGRQGVVPVEIRSNAAGEYGLPLAFDATTIDPLSVRFGTKDAAWAETGGAFEDHGRSHGGDDRMLHFPMADTGLADGEPQACVKGRFTDEHGNVFKFFGCDELRWAGM